MTDLVAAEAARPVSGGSRVRAAVLAILWPGAGHLVAGYPLRAFAMAIVTAFVLIPAALHVFIAPTGGALRDPAALALLLLPAHDAARLAGRPGSPGRGRTALAAAGLALAVPALLFAEYGTVTSGWLVVMELDRESMRPNLLPGDLVLVDVRPGAVAAAEPGALVVFEHPAGSGRFHVKRLAARAGQSVALRDGGLVLDGDPRSESRSEAGAVERIGERRFATIPGPPGATPDFGPATVADGHFFALGDDRAASRDSRAFGDVPVGLLRGLPVRVLFSRDPGTQALRSGRIGQDPRTLP